MKHTAITCIIFLFLACGHEADPSQAKGQWITGTVQEQIQTIEKHFRGFDMAMVETGYRYNELYWAGQDGNWDYADYQLEKIRLTLSHGLERRPLRANAAEHFLSYTLPQMEESLRSRDPAKFHNAFQLLTIGCNTCHAMEKVPFFNVEIPSTRQSPIKYQNAQ